MLCVLCVLFGPVSLACREEPVVPPFSDPIAEFDGVVVLTGAQKASLLDAVRRGLTSELQRPDALLSATPAAGAVLEVWLDGRVACHVAIADGLHVALEQAVAALREDDDFRARVAPKIVDARIKIGVIDRVTRIDIDAEASVPHAARIIAAQFEPGVTGFLLAIGNGHAVLSPDAIVTEGLALDMNQADPVKRRIKRPRLIADLMRRLSREITGKTNAWRSGRLFAFSTQSFIESADTQDGARGAVDLDRGFTTVGDLDNGRLRAAIDANLTYLAGIARNGGTLRYDYDPLTDRETGAYYLPHHAGYVLRHLQAAAMLREPALVDRAMPRLAWLRERIVTPPDAPDVSIVVDGGESLLGTNALMALIFSLLPDAYRQPGDDALRDQFGRAILRFRMDEPGRFYETYAQAAAMSAPKRQPRYFPGVALYALVHLHEATHDDLWLWAAREIGEVLAALWRADGPDAVGRYCWHAMAWARLARVDPDPARRDQWRALGYEHAGAVIARQWRPGQAGYFPAYLGSAKNARPPRTAPTSARAESLYENYLAARFANDDDAAREFAGALSASMRFVIANQYSRENTYFLPHPERAIGGIRGGLAAGDIRIDYNQHALYAMMGLLNSMNAEH